MLKNVLLTNTNEVADLLTPGLAFYVLALGVLPSVVLWACPIIYRPLRSKLRFRAKSTLAAGLACIAIGLVFSQNISSVFRQNRLLSGLFAPLNVVSASAELARKSLRSTPPGKASYGHDARKSSIWSTRHRKSVTVIVVGETARADHFSLNGYPRATNPLLAKVPGLVSFTRAYSCGTNTGQFLPCMFSGLGAKSFRVSGLRHQQTGLLDILQRASFSVLWRENQAGCYGVCKHVPTDVLERAGTRTLFERGKSLDKNSSAWLAGEDRAHGQQRRHCAAHDGQSWADLLQAISASVRALPARLQGKPIQSLQFAGHHQQLRQHARL